MGSVAGLAQKMDTEQIHIEIEKRISRAMSPFLERSDALLKKMDRLILLEERQSTQNKNVEKLWEKYSTLEGRIQKIEVEHAKSSTKSDALFKWSLTIAGMVVGAVLMAALSSAGIGVSP